MKKYGTSWSIFPHNKLVFLLLCLIVFAFHSTHVHAKSAAISQLWTSDSDGNKQSSFSPGDTITINATLSPNGNKSVSVSGEIIGTKVYLFLHFMFTLCMQRVFLLNASGQAIRTEMEKPLSHPVRK